MMLKKGKASVADISLLQALGVVSYIGLISFFFWNAEKWFGAEDTFFAPVIVLTMFSLSVLVCGLITFAYPVILFWDKKKYKKAVKIIAYQAMWLALFFLLLVAFAIYIA